jgi:predicted nucleic acid-binding protein
LFLDTSVLLAAVGSQSGASHAVFDYATTQSWTLVSSPYVLSEVLQNLPKLPASATSEWLRLRPKLTIVDDVLVLDRPAVFMVGKDRPVLFTALAFADVLLTLDKTDFIDVLGREFYGLRVLLPYEFLLSERAAGRLQALT